MRGSFALFEYNQGTLEETSAGWNSEGCGHAGHFVTIMINSVQSRSPSTILHLCFNYPDLSAHFFFLFNYYFSLCPLALP